MGNISKKSEKSSFYEILKKNIKKSFDEIHSSQYNTIFSLKKNEFKQSKLKRNIILEETTDWKSYLLDNLKKYKNQESNNWATNLDIFINTDDFKFSFNKYIYENKTFFKHFSLRHLPEPTSGNEIIYEPILSPLENSEEIKNFTNNLTANVNKEKQENKMIELSFIDTSQLPKEDDENEKIDIVNKSVKDESITISREPSTERSDTYDERELMKYYSVQIKQHISLIREQIDSYYVLEGNLGPNLYHPIYKLISRFTEYYINLMDEYLKDEHIKIKEIKEKVIKD